MRRLIKHQRIIIDKKEFARRYLSMLRVPQCRIYWPYFEYHTEGFKEIAELLGIKINKDFTVI